MTQRAIVELLCKTSTALLVLPLAAVAATAAAAAAAAATTGNPMAWERRQSAPSIVRRSLPRRAAADREAMAMVWAMTTATAMARATAT